MPRGSARLPPLVRSRPVSGHDSEAMDQRGRSDQRIPEGPRIGTMERCKSPRNRGGGGEDTLGKGGQYAVLDPLLDEPALPVVPSLEQQRACLQFQNGDAGEEHVRRRHRVGPCRDIGTGPVRPGVPRRHWCRARTLPEFDESRRIAAQPWRFEPDILAFRMRQQITNALSPPREALIGVVTHQHIGRAPRVGNGHRPLIGGALDARDVLIEFATGQGDDVFGASSLVKAR